MKKNKEKLKMIIIVGGTLLIPLIVIISTILYLVIGFDNRLHVTTNISNYQDVIGDNTTKKYQNKWGMSEEIFPKTVENLNVIDFKMITDSFLDEQYLAYLVVDYTEEEYAKEIKRLNDYGIENYIGYYGISGFTKYKLVAMESSEYNGFIYALTDGKNRIIYVEIIFCNYTMDIDYKNEIKSEYLPDGFDATENNPYRIKMLKENK